MNNKYVLVRENGEQWINSPNNGGECCETKAETVVELNRLLARIKRLDEFVDQLTNPKFTRDDLPKEALLQRIKRLEEAGQRVDDAAHSIQDWSGTVLGDALDELEQSQRGQAVSASMQCEKCLRSCRLSKSGKTWICTICKHRERIKP